MLSRRLGLQNEFVCSVLKEATGGLRNDFVYFSPQRHGVHRDDDHYFYHYCPVKHLQALKAVV